MPAAYRSPIALAVALAIASFAQPDFAADSSASPSQPAAAVSPVPAAPPAAAAEPRKSSEPETEVLVVGTRASLQSAIERKKRAGTVVDSIVAEDVAQFPDK